MRTVQEQLFPRLDAELGDPAALAGFFFRRAGFAGLRTNRAPAGAWGHTEETLSGRAATNTQKCRNARSVDARCPSAWTT